jgi:acetyl-CoA carboxylase carboxyl transferase subunit beta
MKFLDAFKGLFSPGKGSDKRKNRVEQKPGGGEKSGAVRDERSFVENQHSCPSCHLHIELADLKKNLFVCPGCGHHFSVTAWERIEMLADPDSFRESDDVLETADPLAFPGYAEKLTASRQKAKMNEAIVTGVCSVNSRELALGVMSFSFMGGSMGAVVGEKIVRLCSVAVQRQIPLLLFTASGGARMQEGIISLMQMARTSHAAALLEEKGLPFFIVLTHPTTGGVTASFAMLGNVILAEPGALIGFAGPRVIESTIRQKLPEGFQRAEFQEQKGFVDRVCPRSELRKTITLLIDAHRPYDLSRQSG